MIVSAPGKVILHGEHAVVYGKAAIAASLNLRNYLMLTERHDDKIELSLPSIGMHKVWSLSDLPQITRTDNPGDLFNPMPASDTDIKELKRFLHSAEDSSEPRDFAPVAFLFLYSSIFFNRKLPALSIQVKSLFPVSAGLGSSASFCTCLASALLRLHGILKKPNTEDINEKSSYTWTKDEKDLINKWAFIGEKILHGRPSGIDNSTSTYGGALRFQSGQIVPLENMPKLRILLTNTKVPRSTKVLVENVRKRHTKFPRIVEPLLDSIEEITEAFQGLLRDSNSIDDQQLVMEELVDMNQDILSALGVSHSQLNLICQITAKYGLHTKLTGAGGGGCAFSLLRKDINEDQVKKVRDELMSHGFECWETIIGGSGVTEHTDADDVIKLFS